MTIRHKIRERVSPLLPPGETFAAAFPAVRGIVPRLAFKHRVVAVSDTRVHVFTADLWRVGTPRRLLTTLPAGTVITSERSSYYEIVDLGGERLWVLPANQDLLSEAIDASLAARAALNPIWGSQPG